MISIDRNTIYKTPRYSFKNFVQLSFEEKLNVLNWRNDINVRQWMYHSEVLQLDDHLKFVCQDHHFILILFGVGVYLEWFF